MGCLRSPLLAEGLRISAIFDINICIDQKKALPLRRNPKNTRIFGVELHKLQHL